MGAKEVGGTPAVSPQPCMCLRLPRALGLTVGLLVNLVAVFLPLLLPTVTLVSSAGGLCAHPPLVPNARILLRISRVLSRVPLSLLYEKC